ncbi:MAG: nucleotidyltransferase domain-containing protein [Balneolaceae bacterium]
MILEDKQTKEIVSRLQTELEPTVIYLFGSQVNGRAVERGSDVDLCVVVADDDEDTYRKTVRAYRCLRDLRFPKDVIVRHQTNFDKKSHWLSSVEHEVTKTGRMIYRR